ncbi:MAG: toll/interleukin-1 receptor domain-containing protein, partial [Deltaproteobacteria bacterium]|nr:toll/interleukin-1 receptor domain-containing protein [Deltaproteobacteria bacterium]
IFLSYSRVDVNFAKRLTKDIELFGFTVWIDVKDMKVGDSIVKNIETGIENSTWMIIILSNNSISSKWVENEMNAGIHKSSSSKHFFILPVLYEKIKKIPTFLKDIFYADFTKSYEEGLNLLKDRLISDYYNKKMTETWFLVKNPLAGALTKFNSFSSTYQSLYNNNIRQSMYHFANLGEDVRFRGETEHIAKKHSENDLSFYLPKKNKKYSDLFKSIPSEIWFGDTGRLILHKKENILSGEYDWYGISLPGKINGKFYGEMIFFSWDWNLSSEKGYGIFWTDIPDILHGGWWMDYENIDKKLIMSKSITPPHNWSFVKINSLKIENNVSPNKT